MTGKIMIINNKNIQVYSFNGTLVFLAYTDDMPGVKPLETAGDIGAYNVNDYNGCDVCLTTDDIYSGPSEDGAGIITAECVNPGNDQKLVEGWWTEQYNEDDEFEREYLTTTDSHYDWTSERSHMIKQIENASREGMLATDTYASLKAEWDKAVTEAARNCSNYTASDAPFDALLNEADVEVG